MVLAELKLMVVPTLQNFQTTQNHLRKFNFSLTFNFRHIRRNNKTALVDKINVFPSLTYLS